VSNEQAVITEHKKVNTSDCILLGKFVGVWGVKGWLKVFSYTRPRQDIGSYKQWLLIPQKVNLSKQTEVSAALAEIKKCKEQGQNIVAKLESVDYRDQAQALIGMNICILREQLKDLPEGEFYWSEMLDCQVINQQGDDLGIVNSILETGANDVLVVHQQMADGTTQERLIPYSMDTVLSLDIEQKQILVDWQTDYLVEEKQNAKPPKNHK